MFYSAAHSVTGDVPMEELTSNDIIRFGSAGVTSYRHADAVRMAAGEVYITRVHCPRTQRKIQPITIVKR